MVLFEPRPDCTAAVPQGMLVANKRSLMERPGLLRIVHELIERFDAHLKAEEFYSVIANMRGESPDAVAKLLLKAEGLQGLQGPTISNVYSMNPDGSGAAQVRRGRVLLYCQRIQNLNPCIRAQCRLRYHDT